ATFASVLPAGPSARCVYVVRPSVQSILLAPPSLSKLREAQNVPVRICEPSHPHAAGRRPYAELVLLDSPVALEFDAGLLETLDCSGDVRDLPAEHGVLGCRCFLHHGNAQHRAAGVENQGEAVFVHQPKTQSVTIELPGATGIGHADKRHDLLRTEHGVLLSGPSLSAKRRLS